VYCYVWIPFNTKLPTYQGFWKSRFQAFYKSILEYVHSTFTHNS